MLSRLSRSGFWPVTIIILAILTGIFAGSNWGGILRQLLVFIFLLICPGMAVIRIIHLENPQAEFILGIALSLSITAILAEVMVMLQLWSPSIGLAILIVISLVGAILQFFNPLTRKPGRG